MLGGASRVLYGFIFSHSFVRELLADESLVKGVGIIFFALLLSSFRRCGLLWKAVRKNLAIVRMSSKTLNNSVTHLALDGECCFANFLYFSWKDSIPIHGFWFDTFLFKQKNSTFKLAGPLVD